MNHILKTKLQVIKEIQKESWLLIFAYLGALIGCFLVLIFAKENIVSFKATFDSIIFYFLGMLVSWACMKFIVWNVKDELLKKEKRGY